MTALKLQKGRGKLLLAYSESSGRFSRISADLTLKEIRDMVMHRPVDETCVIRDVQEPNCLPAGNKRCESKGAACLTGGWGKRERWEAEKSITLPQTLHGAPGATGAWERPRSQKGCSSQVLSPKPTWSPKGSVPSSWRAPIMCCRRFFKT